MKSLFHTVLIVPFLMLAACSGHQDLNDGKQVDLKPVKRAPITQITQHETYRSSESIFTPLRINGSSNGFASYKTVPRNVALAPRKDNHSKTAAAVDHSKSFSENNSGEELTVRTETPAADKEERYSMYTKSARERCSLKARFDTGETVAYQWDGNKRLGLDLDTRGPSVTRAYLRFKMAFNPGKRDKPDKCLYQSNWQGLVGSGYNELFRRNDNTVWQEIRTLKSEAEERLNTLFQR